MTQMGSDTQTMVTTVPMNLGNISTTKESVLKLKKNNLNVFIRYKKWDYKR